MARRKFTPDEEQNLACEYAAGAGLADLVKKHGGSTPSVAAAIRRAGGTIRPRVRNTKWTEDCAEDALALWKQGVSVREVARRFKTRTKTISDLLAHHGIEPDVGPRIHKQVRGREAEIAKRYIAGESLNKLSKAYKCSNPTIVEALHRQGVELRGLGVSKVWTVENIAWACEQYRSGNSQVSIAKALNVSAKNVGVQLRRAGAIEYERKKGKDHHAWQGGRVAAAGGYVRVKMQESDRGYAVPNSTGYVLEHRLVMGKFLGRELTPAETVHHINGDRADNRLENLQLRSGVHGKGVARRCVDCGSHNIEDVPLADAA